MKNNTLSRSQQELLNHLGSNYTTRRIDLENCIYRDYGNYNVEVSGGHTKRSKFAVFVWQRKPHLEIVERYLDIPHDYGKVACLLADITARFSDKPVACQ